MIQSCHRQNVWLLDRLIIAIHKASFIIIIILFFDEQMIRYKIAVPSYESFYGFAPIHSQHHSEFHISRKTVRSPNTTLTLSTESKNPLWRSVLDIIMQFEIKSYKSENVLSIILTFFFDSFIVTIVLSTQWIMSFSFSFTNFRSKILPL